MNKKLFLLIFVGIFFLFGILPSINALTWTANSSIVEGITNLASYSTPYVFQKGEDYYLTSGNNSGHIRGFTPFANLTWKPNTTIVSGLSDVGDAASFIVFYKDSSWYGIAGTYDVKMKGYVLATNGTTWISNSTIVSGLPTFNNPKPSVFYKDNSWYMISGAADGVARGFTLAANGTTWISNSTIVSGIPDLGINTRQTVFKAGNDWYLISGENNGNFFGYNLATNGTTWISNSTIVSGLTDVGVGSAPTVFQKGGFFYLITGNGSGGFTGFQTNQLPTPPIIEINLDTPLDGVLITKTGISFVANFNITNINFTNINYNWTNATFFIWYENGTLLNPTNVDLGSNTTSISYTKFINVFKAGDYLWDVEGFYSNSTFSNSTFSSNGNFSFSVNPLIETFFTPNTFETSLEYYGINLSTDFSITNSYLNYSGTINTMTNQGSGIWNVSKVLSSSNIGNNSLQFIYTTSGTNFSSQNYQQVNPILFGLCNATLTIPYLNFSFADEDTLSSINASIPTSTFVYYLSTSTVNKTLTFTNTTENDNYEFCFNPPNRTLIVDSQVQYKGTNYPQRIYDPDAMTYTNATTNTTLYLLATADGIFVTYQILNNVDQSIGGASVSLTRTINSKTVTVANGLTGADGTVTFWLNPDFQHELTVSKSGYDTYITSQFPTQTSYTITLSGAVSGVGTDYTKGISTFIYPRNKELFNDTTYNFIFNLTSDFWEIDSFGFNLRLANGTKIIGGTSTTEGSGVSLNYDVNNQTIIYMDYFWKIEGNFTNASTYWVITNTEFTGWSIKTLFTDIKTVLNSEVFGIDNFGRYIITFLILFISVGIFSYKYGFTSPVPLSIMTFAIIYFLDVVIDLIPAIRGIDNLVTYLAGLIMAIVIISEVTR